MRKKGFTLIELLIVVSVIGILSGLIISVINPTKLRARARDSQRIADLKKIQTALELRFSDTRNYPTSASFARVTTSLTSLSPGYYNGSLPVDPNGYTALYSCGGNYDYNYKTNAAGSIYVIVAKMETTSVDYETCNLVRNCKPAPDPNLGCNCSTLCHAVQNPF